MQICAPSPLPTFNALYSLIPRPLLPFSVPALPCLPNPIYANLVHPELEIVTLVHELQTYQYFSIFLAFLTPLVNFLGIPLSSILPSIPIAGINLINLLALQPNNIYAAISQIPSELFSLFPTLPVPIFSNISVPTISLLNEVKFITTGYMADLITTVTNLIGTVTNQLHLPGLPTLPSIPSFAAFQNLLLAAFPGFNSALDVLMSGVSISTLFNITIPGFPPLPQLPNPLIPNFLSPEIALMETFKIMNAELTNFPMSIILSFCLNTLSTLGFSFPTLCITI